MPYMRNLLLFAEGKFFSNRSDIMSMARKLAGYERDAAVRVNNEEIVHWELSDIWNMIETLDGAIPESQRPSQVQILTSLGDQRIPVQGKIRKDPLECCIARVSCQNLEELYFNEVKLSLAESNRYMDRSEAV